MAKSKNHTQEQLLQMEYNHHLCNFIKKILGKNDLPETHRRLANKIAWHCVMNGKEPRIFHDALSTKDSNKCFAEVGGIMGVNLSYEKEKSQCNEYLNKSENAQNLIRDIVEEITPLGIKGALKGRYNTAAIKLAWHCINNDLDATMVLNSIKDKSSIEGIEEHITGIKALGSVHTGMSPSIRSAKEQIECENGYFRKMELHNVTTDLQPLIFDMLTIGRSKYTALREFTADIIQTAEFIKDMKSPLNVWKATEALLSNLSEPKKATPELLTFAEKITLEYPTFSGDANFMPPDYSRATSQFFGLTLMEAKQRPFESNKTAAIAKNLTECLDGVDCISDEVLKLAKMVAPTKENVPYHTLHQEMDFFSGHTIQSAFENFESIINKGLRLRCLDLAERLGEYVKFDSDQTERMFQKNILQEVAYQVTISKSTISNEFLLGMKGVIPEVLSREIMGKINAPKSQENLEITR